MLPPGGDFQHGALQIHLVLPTKWLWKGRHFYGAGPGVQLPAFSPLAQGLPLATAVYSVPEHGRAEVPRIYGSLSPPEQPPAKDWYVPTPPPGSLALCLQGIFYTVSQSPQQDRASVAHRGHLLSYTPFVGFLSFSVLFPLPPGVSSLSRTFLALKSLS